MVMVLWAMLAWCEHAVALDPRLDVSQYGHTSWKIGDGFAKGPIRSITQTPDGYLWLASEFGLLRFDGVRAVTWQPPGDQSLPSSDIWSVLATRDGALWIGTSKGLAQWKHGTLTQYAELAGRYVTAILEDREGTVWAGGTAVPTAILCAIRESRATCSGDDVFGPVISALYDDQNRNLWVGTTGGIWRWRPGPPAFFPVPGPTDSVQALVEDHEGALIIASRSGLRRFLHGPSDQYRSSGTEHQASLSHLLRDRDGGLWAGMASKGIMHIVGSRTDVFTQADGLSSDVVAKLFEDREGNVWVATANGLDRFRGLAVSSFSEKQGLSNMNVQAVTASPDGSLFISSSNGVERWTNGLVHEVRGRGLPPGAVGNVFVDDSGRTWLGRTSGLGYLEHNTLVMVDRSSRAVRSIVQGADDSVWVSDQSLGLLHWSPGGQREWTAWSALGRKDFATALAVDRRRGGLWLGFWDGGIAYYMDGIIREAFTTRNGLSAGRITGFRWTPDESLFVATEGGLSTLRNGRVVTITSKNGLPCDGVNWVIEDDVGSLWLNMPCGLVRVATADVDAWVADQSRSIRPVVFDSSDGVRSEAAPSGYEPFVVKAKDGRLWFVRSGGLDVVDPRRLPLNDLPPPVHIERVTADRKALDADALAEEHMRLPALTRDLQIDFTALSLVAPERNRFRYRLDGYDRDWQDAGNRRQAFYTNLPPRSYRFRVIASNNSGVWNETGAALDFSIAPAYYQTWWFVALSAGIVLALVWGAHRLRLGIVERHQREISALNERLMKAQEQERIRIAGDLHDGVMQEMLAVTMMLGTAKRKVGNDAEAKAVIDKVQEKVIKVGTDIRRVSHDLHPPVLQAAGLPQALQVYCEEFSATSGISVSCEAAESARDLSRGAALALFRIVQEALGNAVKHGAARRITVRLQRSGSDVTLDVSDDGIGFDRSRLAAAGGLGLITMRERASQLDGTFDVESAPGRGTTIRAVIPFR